MRIWPSACNTATHIRQGLAEGTYFTLVFERHGVG
jgi:hypothetical protein